MKPTLQALCLATVLTGGLLAARGETSNAPVKFYCVSEREIEGGRYINTPEFSAIGYIAKTPDLVVTNLKRAFSSVVAASPRYQVHFVLLPEDAERFQAFTRKATGKRYLVTLGEQPVKYVNLAFPSVVDLIDLWFQNETDAKKAEDELKKFVKGKTG